MPNPKSPLYIQRKDRRSGLNRRWIRSSYSGKERRSGNDRRRGLELKDLVAPEGSQTRKMAGMEKLLVSSAIQLEAVTRLLLEKGVITENELLEMMQKVQSEYYNKPKP